MRKIFTALVGIAAASACTSGHEASAPVDMSNIPGATIVDNHEPRWGEGDAWVVSPEPYITIGVLNGPREYELFAVAAAARQSDGDLVVIDGGAREVRLYGRDGTFIRALGGPGSGPGEFQDPAHVVITAADSVLVWDNALYRITRFDAAGEFVGVQSVDRGRIAEAIDPPLYPGTAQLLADGRLLVRLQEKQLTKDLPPGVFRPRSGAVRVSVDLSRVDTLLFFGDMEQASAQAPWGQTPVAPALAMRTAVTVLAARSRACIGDQEGPAVVCFDADASPTVIRWSSEPQPVAEHEVATWRDTTIPLLTLKMSEHEARQMLAQVPVPAVRPPYDRLVLDRVGNLWVERGPADGAAAESVDYLVFDATGALLGSVALPPIGVLEIGDDYVVGVYRDELDVQYLQVYEIVK